MAILKISELSVGFKTPLGSVKAVEDVHFDLGEKETLALVGETGCGKSVIASSILQLLPPSAMIKGEIIFGSRNLLALSEKEMSKIRGREIAIIFQNPSLALNPVYSIGDQIAEPLQIHRRIPHIRSIEIAGDMMKKMGLGGGKLMKMYPFQFSGGMNQRVMIAASMILSPKVIIADEPTKGLDVNIAKEVVREMARIKDLSGLSLLLITHDLSVAKHISDRMAVMYCGEIVEIGKSRDIFRDPMHPYTRALLDCLPEKGYHPVPGESPSMIQPPKGCHFRPRCPLATAKCYSKPRTSNVEDRMVKCWLC